MKKIVFFCLIVLFTFGCSSSTDKPKDDNQTAKDSTVQTSKPESITSLSGDYVYTDVRKKKFNYSGQEYESTRTDTFTLSFTGSDRVIYKVNTDISIEPNISGVTPMEQLYNVYAVGNYTISSYGKEPLVGIEFPPQDPKLPYVTNNKKGLNIRDENTLIDTFSNNQFKKVQ
jgi:hypothetical protein